MGLLKRSYWPLSFLLAISCTSSQSPSEHASNAGAPAKTGVEETNPQFKAEIDQLFSQYNSQFGRFAANPQSGLRSNKGRLVAHQMPSRGRGPASVEAIGAAPPSSAEANASNRPEDFNPQTLSDPTLIEKYKRRSFVRDFRRRMVGSSIPQDGAAKKTSQVQQNTLSTRGVHVRQSSSEKASAQSAKSTANSQGMTRSLTPMAAKSASVSSASPLATSSGWNYTYRDVYFDSYDYQNSMNQLWYTYYAPYGTSRIAVDFGFLDLETNYDYVKIYDEYGLCASYTGNAATFTSSNCYGDYVDIWVSTDSSVSGSLYDGFKINGFYNYDASTPGTPPVAVATASLYSAKINQSIAFDGSYSYDPDDDDYYLTYSWNFGDGYTSSYKYTSHSYSKEGTYIVSLTVHDRDGYVDYDSFFVTVVPNPPDATFTFKANPISTSSTAFIYPRSTTANSLAIDWGDGSTSYVPNYTYNGNGYSHKYTSPGTYIVSEKATNAGGTTTYAQNLTVQGAELPPLLEITNLASLNTTQGKAYALTPGFRITEDGALQSFNLDWGGGTDLVGSIENYPATSLASFQSVGKYVFTRSHTYYKKVGTKNVNMSGVFGITATATDNKNLSRNVAYTYATKNTKPVVAAAITVACVSQACSFTEGAGKPITTSISDPDGTISLYAWDFFKSDKRTLVDGCLTTLNSQTATCTFPTTGAYQVRLRAYDQLGLYTDIWKAVTVTNKLPVVAAITKTCAVLDCNFTVGAGKPITTAITDADGQVAEFHWDFLDSKKLPLAGCASVSGTQTASCRFPATGTYYARVTATDNYGAKGTSTLTVAVTNKVPVIAAITKTCFSRACNFIVGNGKSFDLAIKDTDGQVTESHWDFLDSKKLPLAACPTISNSQFAACTFPSDGTFYARVTATDNYGTQGQLLLSVAVTNKKPVFLAVTAVCTGRNCTATVGAGKAFDAAIKDPDGVIAESHWDFLNKTKTASVCPTVSDSQSASCALPAAGTYYIRLRATDNFGGMTEVFKAVTVK